MAIDSALSVPPAQRIVSVAELLREAAAVLERTFALSWVSGEISNLTRAASGHWYFSLKDRDAQVRCVMFRARNQAVDWVPREGDRVEARVLPGLYVPRGDFQLQVEQLRRAGAGVLFEAFLRIKATLEAAGLFDAARKRPLPVHPHTIGVVTSLQAAALRDVLTTIARRSPHVRVIVFPTPLQGSEAPVRIVEAIAAAAHPGARHPIDVLLVVRGGGSIEDLWAFNDERVARAIAAARVPVVSGVGHETDFTIADFVADVRAPTPTAAAELASPDGLALASRLARYQVALRRALERGLDGRAQRIDEAARRLRSPQQRLQIARARLNAMTRRVGKAQADRLERSMRSTDWLVGRLRAAAPDTALLSSRTAVGRDRLGRAANRSVATGEGRLAGARDRLVLLDPKGILGRGYAIASDAEGRAIRDPAALRAGQRITIDVALGRFDSLVDEPPRSDAAVAGSAPA